MIKKSIVAQLACYGIFIACFIALGAINYDTKIVLFDAIFNSARIYFFILGILLLIPIGVILCYEIFSSGKQYEESIYNRISVFVIQISGLIIYAISGGVVLALLIINISRLNNANLVIILSFILTFLLMFLIWLFFKIKLKFNILNIFHY